MDMQYLSFIPFLAQETLLKIDRKWGKSALLSEFFQPFWNKKINRFAVKQTLHNGLQRILSMVRGHLDKNLRKKDVISTCENVDYLHEL